MSQLITPQELTLVNPRYNGEKVNCLLKVIRKVSIKNRMNLKRQNTVDELHNYYNTYKYLNKPQFKMLYKLWFNFVMMDHIDEDRV